MKIKNIKGPSDTDSWADRWLQEWKKLGGENISYCPEKRCMKTDLVGARVQKAGGADKEWFILPLCSSHSHATGTLDVSDRVTLISAPKEETRMNNQ
jgi:hypothetical protein